MKNTPSELRLRQARKHLMEYGTPPAGTVNVRLARSWQRSLAAGLLPMGRIAEKHAPNDHELQSSLSNNQELLTHSRPVMEYLYDQIKHIQSVVILADKNGMLMHTLGDANFLTKAERVALSAGASWREEHQGTNAIGTALAERSAVEIHGAEHYLEGNGFLTCAAAPIFSSTGQLTGILDISGEHRSGHPMTLGLVSIAARMIENRLLIASSTRQIRLHLHAQAAGIGTVAEGLLAVSEDGWIVGANQQALALLQLSTTAIGITPLESVLDTRLPDLMRQSRRSEKPLLAVRRHNGSALYVTLEAEAGVLPSRSAHTVEASNNSRTDALSALDTGDLKWRSAADKARRVLDKPIPILIQGESGVGKEYFARAMHDSGKRAQGPFVAINCAAIPENLIEAELFGYSEGAFTGALKEGRIGKLREANGGTLFLDEIGDMPLGLQSRLLRVLQERTVTPLGGGPITAVDFALVCATHSNLREASAKGTFRSDLFYRINGLTLHLPALRDRSDFQALTERLLCSLNPGQDIRISPELLESMRLYPWPGNLRQLASVLRTAIAMLDEAESTIELRHLSDDLLEELRPPQTELATARQPAPAQNLDELSRHAIQQALAASSGNISMAARSLGISRQALYRKLQAL